MEISGNAKEFFDQGSDFLKKGKFQNAIIAFQRAKDICEEQGNVPGFSRCLNALGVSYAESGNEVIAVECYMQGLSLAKRNKAVGLSHLFYNNLGSRYQELKDFHTSIKYFLKAEVDLVAGGPVNETNALWYIGCYLNLAISYWHVMDYTNAELYLFKAESIAEEYNAHMHDFAMRIMSANINASIGNFEKARKKIDELMVYLTSGEETIQEYIQDAEELLYLLKKLKEYDSMKFVLENFEEIAKEYDMPFVYLELQKHKMDYYECIGDSENYKKACVDHANYYLQVRKINAEESVMALDMKLTMEKTEAEAVEAKRIAEEDQLTGLRNRSCLAKDWQKIVSMCANDRAPLLVGMIDVDYFKNYNDTYGHLEGDEALKKLSDVFKLYLSDLCKIYRYGGDEFLIIIANSPYEEGFKIADGISKKIASLKLLAGDNVPYPYLTVSQGWYHYYPSIGDELQKTIEEADNLLYEIKNNGKNSFVITKRERGY